MPSLSQSPILQALGYAIANSLWQMAMVWIVYVLLNSIFKFRSEIKYRIAVAAQVTGFAWFIVTLQFYYQQCSQALELAEAFYQQNGETVVLASEKGSLINYFIKAEQVLPYLSVAYLLLLLFLTVRWFRAYRYTQLVRLNGLHKIDVDWKLFVGRVAGQMGIKQKVRIYLSELVQSPVTIGFLKPVILVPIASINHLSAQQLEAVILHELAHIRRHDYILNIVLSAIELALFFNPFTRLITKSVSKERENSCDDWVLQFQYNASMYAEALLRIAVLQKSPTMAMYAVKTKGELLSRVQRMVHQKDTRFNYRHQLVALLLMTGILTSLAWFDPAEMKGQDVKLSANDQAVVIEPLAAKVNNPLMNPFSFLNEPMKEEVKKTIAANQKTLQRSRRQLATAGRVIELPKSMAPVAIENLKDLEKNIVSINKDMRRTLLTMPSAVKLAKSQVYLMDSLKFAGNMTFFSQENWNEVAAELRKSQKAIDEAWRKGTLSKTEAKKIQSEIAEAFQQLREMQLPKRFYAQDATGGSGNAPVFYRPAMTAAQVEAERERARSESERKRINQHETRLNKAKKETDSLKYRYIARAGAKISQPHMPEAHGYLALAEGAPVVIVDGKSIGVRSPVTVTIKPKTPAVNGQAPVTYTYVYSDVEMEAETGDECEKANKHERSRRLILGTTVARPKLKPSSVRVKKTSTNGSCSTGVTSTRERNAEAIEASQFEQQ